MSIIKKIKTTITQEISQLIRYRTELVIIDESEYSELQDQAALFSGAMKRNSKLRQQITELESDIESITNDATEDEGEVRILRQEIVVKEQDIESVLDDLMIADDEVRDLKKELEEWRSVVSNSFEVDVDDVKERLALLDEWQSLSNSYLCALDVSDVKNKLDTLAEWEDLIYSNDVSEVEEKLETFEEWDDVMGRGFDACEVEEKIELADEWDDVISRGDSPHDVEEKLIEHEELKAKFEQLQSQLAEALEISRA